MTGLMDMLISKWHTRWMQDMSDILICIAEQNGWPMPTPFPDMFKRFPPPSEEDNEGEDDDNNDKEETLIVPLDYERVF
ncbi:hypothetical protein J1N35_040438 [Gossypium stocksii]|uniref:Uncharacterized protein n=1 Tax=Gossypium stocksii TaxID=47602 RepID=A0A9D3ZHP2_9ROSI|nr:hypothetical protein J1N35_040438 [Gossypium stocksii]